MEVEASEPRNRPYETPLTNSPGAGGTTFSVADGDAFQVGDQVETPAGELALVTAISTNDLTVTRATRSIAAENVSSGDLLKKNPRFSLEQMDNAVDNILQELDPSGVFYMLTETVAYTTDDFYDVTDTAMDDVFSTWYIDNGNFHVPYFYFMTDPANTQPKIYLAAAGFSGNIHVVYRRPYAVVTEFPDRVAPMIIAGAVYRLMGGATILATDDPGQRTDRTVQGGQEGRDSYWYFREFRRLKDVEVAYLADQVKRVPTDRLSQRSRRYRK